MVLTDLDDASTERVVLDPVAMDPSGETTIDWFVPSPDGRRVAVSLSEHGSEDGTLHVYDVESGDEVCEPIPHVNVMGGTTAWRGDGAGLWYTLPGDPAGFVQQVWFRDLEAGTDRLDLDGPFADPEIAENFLSSSPDGQWVLDRVQKGDGGEWQLFVRAQDEAGRRGGRSRTSPTGAWRPSSATTRSTCSHAGTRRAAGCSGSPCGPGSRWPTPRRSCPPATSPSTTSR